MASVNKELMAIDINALSKAINRLGNNETELFKAGSLVVRMIKRRLLLDKMKQPVNMKYSIYIPSKLNAVRCITPRLLLRSGVPFKLVIEPQDKLLYQDKWGYDNLLLLPENNMGLSYARNFIMEYSYKIGEKKHWQLDDDIGGFSIIDEKGIATGSNPSRALNIIENECDRYSNIAMASPSNQAFPQKSGKKWLCNKLIASCILMDNSCNNIFFSIDRVEDIDCCLEVLSSGQWCTLKFANVLMGKGNDLQVSGNYNAMEKYREAVRIIMEKWPGVFSVNKFGRLRANKVWSTFKQRPLAREMVDYIEKIEYGIISEDNSLGLL